MKKVLFILSTELSAFQMLTYLKQNNEKHTIDMLIQIDSKNLYNHKKNKIFKKISKKLFFIKQPPLPFFFSILKFWNIFLGYKNKLINKNINNYLKKIYFNLNNYDEVYFSNDSVSNYILFNSHIKKIYFDHSPIDTLLKSESNFLKKIKNYLECLINNNFMYIYYKGNQNFEQKSIFSNFLKKKSSNYLLSIKIFREIFFKFNKEKVKKNSKINYNLINFYVPYYAFDLKNSETILKSYINFFIKNILIKIFIISSHKDIFLFKFRQNIPIKFQMSVVDIINKKFPNKNIVLANKKITRMKNLEKIIYNYKIKRYFSSYSSSIYLSKVLNPRIKIYEYGSNWSDFLKKNWNSFKHKNNYNNYLLASKLYRNIAKKL